MKCEGELINMTRVWDSEFFFVPRFNIVPRVEELPTDTETIEQIFVFL